MRFLRFRLHVNKELSTILLRFRAQANCGSVSHLQDENLLETTPVSASADNLEVTATRRVPEGAVFGRLWFSCKNCKIFQLLL